MTLTLLCKYCCCLKPLLETREGFANNGFIQALTKKCQRLLGLLCIL